MADPSNVFVYAVIKPAEGKKDEVEAGIKELVSLVEANEPGCLRYNFFYNADEGTYHVAEQYKDLAALEAHKSSEHFARATKEGMEGKLAAPPSIHIVKPIAGFVRN